MGAVQKVLRSKIGKKLAQQANKSELEQALGLASDLKKLQNLTTSNFSNFDLLIQDYLKTGLEIFGLEIGIVSEINGNEYVILDVIDGTDSIKRNDQYKLADTYCQEVVNKNKVIAYSEVGIIPHMQSHPVYQCKKLESYISAPIFVEGKVFGTLNFTSKYPRIMGFSEHEIDMIAIMGNSIGNFLEIHRREQKLKESNKRIKQLVGYVAHDLRNPLSNISALSQFISNKDIADAVEASAEKGLEIVHTILTAAAAGSGKIKITKEPLNWSDLVRKVGDSFAEIGKERDLHFNFEIQPSLIATIDHNRMEQVLNNIYSNTIKYTPFHGCVNTLLKKKNGSLELVITNQKIKGFVSNQKTSNIKKSIGFGLEIIREILKLHEAEMLIEDGEDYYKISFNLLTDQ